MARGSPGRERDGYMRSLLGTTAVLKPAKREVDASERADHIVISVNTVLPRLLSGDVVK